MQDASDQQLATITIKDEGSGVPSEDEFTQVEHAFSGEIESTVNQNWSENIIVNHEYFSDAGEFKLSHQHASIQTDPEEGKRESCCMPYHVDYVESEIELERKLETCFLHLNHQFPEQMGVMNRHLGRLRKKLAELFFHADPTIAPIRLIRLIRELDVILKATRTDVYFRRQVIYALCLVFPLQKPEHILHLINELTRDILVDQDMMRRQLFFT